MLSLYQIYQNPLLLSLLLIPIIVWSLAWKGFSLWHSAKSNQKWWFFFLLILNTAGLLEIVYLIFFRKKKTVKDKEEVEKPVKMKQSKK